MGSGNYLYIENQFHNCGDLNFKSGGKNMTEVKSIPEGFHTLTPYIVVFENWRFDTDAAR